MLLVGRMHGATVADPGWRMALTLSLAWLVEQEWKRVNELHKAQNARPTYKFFPSVRSGVVWFGGVASALRCCPSSNCGHVCMSAGGLRVVPFR